MALINHTKPKLARGIRNNNPGNIRHNAANNWVGAIGIDDAGFVIFDTPEHGIRAMRKVLESYGRRGIDSMRGIIETWAPRVENNTDSYIQSVALQTGWNPETILSTSHYPEMVKAIIKHENGSQPYSDQVIFHALQLA